MVAAFLFVVFACTAMVGMDGKSRRDFDVDIKATESHLVPTEYPVSMESTPCPSGPCWCNQPKAGIFLGQSSLEVLVVGPFLVMETCQQLRSQ